MVKQLSIFFFLFSFLSVFSQNKTETYIEKYSSIAIDEMNRYNIPASITLAQGILESGNGESMLAIEGKNHFGIKCHNNWDGETIIEDDDEKGECFRKYKKVADAYRDHSLFLTQRERYAFLFLLSPTNYKAWAKGLKKAGYATNLKYPSLLIDLIEKYNLDKFDRVGEKGKQLYFAHSYGLPYLSGVGAYYFKERSLFYAKAQTSFVFSGVNLGYNYELLNKFYAGANAGIIYLPTKETTIVPQIAVELIYKKNIVLIRGGVQIPISEMEYLFIPYFRLTYFLR